MPPMPINLDAADIDRLLTLLNAELDRVRRVKVMRSQPHAIKAAAEAEHAALEGLIETLKTAIPV